MTGRSQTPELMENNEWKVFIFIFFSSEDVDSMRNIPINGQKRCFCLHYLRNPACSDDILKHYMFMTVIMLPFPAL